MSASPETWLDDPYFEDADEESLDGVGTSQGPLWHAVSPRWGHSMHAMCSYHGMFPARLAHYFVQRYSSPGDTVLDPFSGRGTTVLEALVTGRQAIGNDLSPLAFVLSRAKAAPPTWKAVMTAVNSLEAKFRRDGPTTVFASPDIAMLYHPNTLAQLVFIRSELRRRGMAKWSRTDFMIAGAVAGILHGGHRKDGSSQYLSISMPNTFSMAPSYVRRYIAENGLTQPDQIVFDRLREKLARLYLDSLPSDIGSVTRRDANAVMRSKTIPAESVDLVLTSPPYLDVVNYGTSNWIRLWWLGLDGVGRDSGAGRRSLNAELDHRHSYATYRDFMRRTFVSTARVLKKDGIAVLVIGDVAAPGEETVALAEAVWDDVGASTGLRLVDVIDDSLPAQSKVSRIWGETKGQATDRDRALILVRVDGEARPRDCKVRWVEAYKDAGPDAAHDRLRRRA